MRKLILATVAAVIVATPMTTAVRAQDSTTVIKKGDGDTTVIKKRDEPAVLPVPHVEEHKTIIKKED
jgi:hypothetical protein